MEKLEKFLNKYSFLVILILSLPAIWALFVPGFYGASDDLHIAWLHQMDATIKAGKFPPRFVPDLSYGFGYPLFNFVFPLPFYLGEVFHLLGLSFVDSIKAVFALSIPVSMYFMYKFLRALSATTTISLAGAVLYVFTPYRSTDIFVRGAIGEALAFAFPPLIALAIVRLTNKKGNKWVGILGFSVAALLVSHNIMAYMFIPFLALLAVMKIFLTATPRPRIFFKIFLGFILGLLISIYFWLPAIVESALMKYDTVFNYVDHFPTLRQLIIPYFGYGASVPGPGDGMSFFIGVINLLLVIIGVITLFILKKKLSKDQSLLMIWALITFAIAIFMMNFRSTFIWDNLPLIPYFQFPWRFLSLVTFITPVFVVSLQKFKFGRFLGLPIIVLALALNSSYFRPNEFLGRQDNYFINRYIPVPVASEEYKKTSEEYLRLPKATEKRPDQVYPRLTVTNGTAENIVLVNGLDANFEVITKRSATVNYNKYFFPGWLAKVDGQAVPLGAGKPFGQITFEVPSGKHSIEVRFEETFMRSSLNAISIISLLAGAIIVIKGKNEK